MSDTTVYGVGPVPTGHVEYTSEQLKQQYEEYMGTIIDLYNKTTPYTTEDYEALMEAMEGLSKLLLEGDTTSVPGQTSYLTPPMIASISLTFSILGLAGITPQGATGDPLEAMEEWQSLGSNSYNWLPQKADGTHMTVDEFMASAMDAATYSTRTLQSMVEMEFVKDTFDYFAVVLSDLQAQIKNSKDILDNLNSIQNILNELKVPTVPSFNWPPKSAADIPPESVNSIINTLGGPNSASGKAFKAAYDADVAAANELMKNNPVYTFEEAMAQQHRSSDYLNNAMANDKDGKLTTQLYKNVAEVHFANPSPVVNLTDQQVIDIARELQKTVENLTVLRDELIAQSGIGPDSPEWQNSTAYYVDKVIQDITECFKDVDPNNPDIEVVRVGVNKYIMDENGTYQANLQNAITSAQSLNESQLDKFKQQYEAFQEFIKIASMVLQSITKILEGSASKIKGA